MNKYKYSILLLLCGCLFLSCSCTKHDDFDEPLIPLIDWEIEPLPDDTDFFDGMISNAFFGITVSDPDKALENVSRLQHALDSAVIQGITSLKLERGVYYFDGRQPSRYLLTSVMVPSNIHLDLNGSTLVHVANDEPRYVILAVNMVSNVKIFNGTLIGDRNTHTYTSGSNHAWGFGVYVRGSSDVEIFGLTIMNMTGDGICITGYNLAESDRVESSQITIRDCLIHNCRRQGISVVGVNGLEIYGNEIRDIHGTDPQSCIDIETSVGNDLKKNSNISIHDNTLIGSPDTTYRRTIVCQKGSNNVQIQDNVLVGRLSMRYGENIIVSGNTISDGDIDMTNGNDNDIFNVLINDNAFSNYNIRIKNKKDIYIMNNTIQDGTIRITNSSVAIIDNDFIANKTISNGIYVEVTTKDIYYYLNIVGNEYSGKFGSSEKVKQSRYLSVSDARLEIDGFDKLPSSNP